MKKNVKTVVSAAVLTGLLASTSALAGEKHQKQEAGKKNSCKNGCGS